MSRQAFSPDIFGDSAMGMIDALIELACWLLLIDSADKRDDMPKGYRRRYALILYRVTVIGLLVYFIVRISGCAA